MVANTNIELCKTIEEHKRYYQMSFRRLRPQGILLKSSTVLDNKQDAYSTTFSLYI